MDELLKIGAEFVLSPYDHQVIYEHNAHGAAQRIATVVADRVHRELKQAILAKSTQAQLSEHRVAVRATVLLTDVRVRVEPAFGREG